MVQGEAVTLFGRLGFEVFVECPRPWQRGFWIDRAPGWVRVGLGVVMLGVCRR